MKVIGAPGMWKRNAAKPRRRNARPRPSFKPGELASPRTDHAYRGYLLKYNFMRGEWYVSKDGYHIGTAGSLRDAYQIVDLLTGKREAGPSAFRGLNPKGTRVSRCVRKVKRTGRARSAYALCQRATGQSYATGRKLNKGMIRFRNPLPFAVSFKTGPAFAQFRSLPRAKQYAQALVKHTNRAVRVWG